MKTINLSEEQVKNLLIFLSRVPLNPMAREGITPIESMVYNNLILTIQGNSLNNAKNDNSSTTEQGKAPAQTPTEEGKS